MTVGICRLEPEDRRRSRWTPHARIRSETVGQERVKDLLGNVKELAREYYTLTGRPLGVTAEIAEYEAVLLLGLELAPVRQPEYDAIRETASGRTLLQIKGRRIPAGANSGQRVGRIDLEGEWDAVLLVLLDETFEATAIYEAGRPAITSAIQTPGSRARNRGQLGVGLFKALGEVAWSRPGSMPSG